jgi:hypothetical protein
MSDHEFGGAFARVPAGLWHRLALYARQQLARELRWADPDVDAVAVLENFLATRDGGPARSLPFPSAEPGDLLVKVARAETWAFTVHGWRELAPVEIQPGHGETPHGEELGVDPTIAQGPQFPTFEQRGRVKGLRHTLEGMGSGVAQGPQDVDPTIYRGVDVRGTAPLIRAAAELGIVAGAVRRTIEVAEAPDLGIDDRLRAFAEGIETARLIVLEVPE